MRGDNNGPVVTPSLAQGPKRSCSIPVGLHAKPRKNGRRVKSSNPGQLHREGGGSTKISSDSKQVAKTEETTPETRKNVRVQDAHDTSPLSGNSLTEHGACANEYHEPPSSEESHSSPLRGLSNQEFHTTVGNLLGQGKSLSEDLEADIHQSAQSSEADPTILKFVPNDHHDDRHQFDEPGRSHEGDYVQRGTQTTSSDDGDSCRNLAAGDSHPPLSERVLQPEHDTLVAVSFWEDEAVALDQSDAEEVLEINGYTCRSPVCRCDLWCKEERLNTCVDSGATLTLMSSKAYDRIKYTGCVSDIRPNSAILTGASGKRLEVRGVAEVQFALGDYLWTTPVLVGELSGVDMLLGMDWLVANEAHIDFNRMLLRIRRDVVVDLNTSKSVYTKTYGVRASGRSEGATGVSEEYSDCVDGYVQVRWDKTVPAGHAALVPCYATGPCPPNFSALFSPLIHLGEGMEVIEGLVAPQRTESGAWAFDVGVCNYTTEDFEVKKHVLLGWLQPLETKPVSRGNVHQTTSQYAVWEIAHQVLRQEATYIDVGSKQHPDHVRVERTCETRLQHSDADYSQLLVHELGVKGLNDDSKLGDDSEGGKILYVSDGTSAGGQESASPALSSTGGKQHVRNSFRETASPMGDRSASGGTTPSPDGRTTIEQANEETLQEPHANVLTDRLREDTAAGDVLLDARTARVMPQRKPPEPLTSMDAILAQKAAEVSSSPEAPNSQAKLARSDLNGLAEHLRCMMPPEGVLKPEEQARVIEMLTEFQDIFVGPDGKVGYNDMVKHSIETDGIPYKSRPRAKSEQEKQYIAEEVLKLLKEGKIEPSRSPWGAPVVLVKKKDGTLRFCIDFRRLNDVTKKDAYPLPRIDECLNCLNGSKWFCTLDLASGYWQVAMDPEDKEKTAFVTHNGLYHWVVMPFGLCNAPATFCRLMETILADIVWSRCLVYLDDIVAFGPDFETCLSNLRAVFVRLRASNLKLKAKKCELFRQSVDYLGHEVSAEGIRPSKKKVETLHDWKMPRTISEVRSFVGFCSYYRRFIPKFSDLSAPFVALTKKGVPCHTNTRECREAFEELKETLLKLPLLHYADPSKPFLLDADASDVAIGACLSQLRMRENGEEEEVPIAFASKTLSDSRRAYCTTKKELYAIVFFMRYWRGYLSMAKTVVRTDHGSLRWLTRFGLDGLPGGSMYSRWIAELQSYEPYTITTRPGHKHQNADGMSRARHGHSVRGKYKECGLEICKECKNIKNAITRCKPEESDDTDEEDSDDRDPRDDQPPRTSQQYSTTQLRRLRQRSCWGVTRTYQYTERARKAGVRRRGRWKVMEDPIAQRMNMSVDLEELVNQTNVAFSRKMSRGRAYRRMRLRKALEEEIATVRELCQQLNTCLRTECSGSPELELTLSRVPVEIRGSLLADGPVEVVSQTMGTDASEQDSEPSCERVLHRKPRGGLRQQARGRRKRKALKRDLDQTSEVLDQMREGRNPPEDSGYSSAASDSAHDEDSGDDIVEPRVKSFEPLPAKNSEQKSQFSVRKLPARGAREKAKQAIKETSPRRGKVKSSEKKGKRPAKVTIPPVPVTSETQDKRPESTSDDNGSTPSVQETQSVLKQLKWSTDAWKKAQEDDPVISRLMELLRDNDMKPGKTQCRREIRPVSQIIHSSWHYLRYNSQGILCRRIPRKGAKHRYVWQRLVPSVFQEEIVRYIHQETCMHLGYTKVYQVMTMRFFWYNMSQDLLQWVRACKSCQQTKKGQGGSKLELRQEIVGAPMERLAMDLQGPFPESQQGNKYVLVIQDYFSKWVELFAIPDKSGITIATILNDEIFCRYASCCEILSDKGLEFQNAHVKQVLDAWGVKQTRTSGYAPWSNGMLERSNRVLKGLLRQNAKATMYHWDERLPQMRLTMNTVRHSTTGETPYRVWFSRCEEANLPIDLFTGKLPEVRDVECLPEYLTQQLSACYEIHDSVRRETGRQAESQAKHWRRSGLRIRKYRVGDMVWRFYPPHKADKLNPNVWTGPYEVMDVDDTSHLVKLNIPGLGRGGTLKPTWVHTSNVKPVIYSRDGRLMEEEAFTDQDLQ